MRIYRKKQVHVRYEPFVDNGTTYAFSYRKDRLIIGKERLYKLYCSVPENGKLLESLIENLVNASSAEEDFYCDAKALLVDLTRLIDAQVLAIKSTPES